MAFVTFFSVRRPYNSCEAGLAYGGSPVRPVRWAWASAARGRGKEGRAGSCLCVRHKDIRDPACSAQYPRLPPTEWRTAKPFLPEQAPDAGRRAGRLAVHTRAGTSRHKFASGRSEWKQNLGRRYFCSPIYDKRTCKFFVGMIPLMRIQLEPSVEVMWSKVRFKPCRTTYKTLGGRR